MSWKQVKFSRKAPKKESTKLKMSEMSEMSDFKATIIGMIIFIIFIIGVMNITNESPSSCPEADCYAEIWP